MNVNKKLLLAFAVAILIMAGSTTAAFAADKKPNILVIWGDDIGQDNISAYHRGLMGSRTPNIDRIANEGALMTDAYAQASCTAGRAAVHVGTEPIPHGTADYRYARRQAWCAKN